MKNKLMKSKLSAVLILCILIASSFVISGCGRKNDSTDTLDKILQRGKIIVGVKYDTKPFGYINEDRQLVGFDIDLAKYIAKSILGSENRVEFKQVTPSSRILALNSGEVDMVLATMTVTKQRSEVVDFSKPYYIAGQAILVPKNSDISAMSDLNGRRVIIVFGSTAEKNLHLAAPEAIISGYKTYTSAYSALKNGRADAITSDDTILVGFAISDKSVKLLPRRYSKEPYAAAFRKGTSSLRLKNKVNFIITDMINTGKLNQLKAKWIRY